MKTKIIFEIETVKSDAEIKKSLLRKFYCPSDDDISVWSPCSLFPDEVTSATIKHLTFIEVVYNDDIDFVKLANFVKEFFDGVNFNDDLIDERIDKKNEETEFKGVCQRNIEKPKTPAMIYIFYENSNLGEYEVHLKTDCRDAYDAIRSMIEPIAESYNGG